MRRENFIAGMESDLKLTDKERRKTIIRSVNREPWKTKCTICMGGGIC